MNEIMKIQKILCLALSLLLCTLFAGSMAEETTQQTVYPQQSYAFGGKTVRSYDSDTLKYTVEKFTYESVTCYLSKIWVQQPEKQIRKQTAQWQKNIMRPIHMAQQIPEAALVINGSGYVSPTYPWIPENYPGTNEDYYYTPLGSLTVTDGQVYRKLEGVSYYGLTLEEDGLQMYVDADNEEVLARNPIQTWSFYIQCPLIQDGQEILVSDWSFADRNARRTVIGRVNRNNYLILTVTNEGRTKGLNLHQVCEFYLSNFSMEWVYNLDGGPSSALLCRNKGKKGFTTVMGGTAKDADIMAFTELAEE